MFLEITTIYDAALAHAQSVISDHQRKAARLTVGLAAAKYLAPPPDLPTWRFADENIVLPRAMTARPGRWVSANRPFLIEPMTAMDDPMIEIIDFEKASRMGITTIILHYLIKRLYTDPCAIMYAQQTIGMAKTFNAKILMPYIRANKFLHEIVIEEKSRSAETSTILEKRTRGGGTLSLVGGNVPTGFRMVFQEVVVGDDLDGWAWSVGKEGDPVENMKGRTRDVATRKIILASKPTVKGFSRINLSHEASDKRRYHVECPHCYHPQILRLGGKDLPYGLKWKSDDPYSAYYLCEQCAGVILDHHKREIIKLDHGAKWIPTQTAKNPRHVGFGGLSQLYHPDIPFSDIAKDRIAAGDNPEQLQVFYNDVIGECWEDKGEGINEGGLYARREDWDPGILPEKIAMLTGAADIGDNHIACGIEGWGSGMENWKVDYQLYEGDTLLPEIWEDLRKYVMLTWKHYCGVTLRPMVFNVDAGYRTEMVAMFVNSMKRCGVIVNAVVGREHTKVPEIISGTLPSKKGKHKVNIYTINDDRAKLSVLSRLKVPKPGGGYVHFPNAPWCNAEFFEQFLSEKKVRVRERGVLVDKWIRKPGVRNEPFDVAKYNLASLIWAQKHKRFDLDATALAMARRVEAEKARRMETGELPANEYFLERVRELRAKTEKNKQSKPQMRKLGGPR